MGWNHQLEDHAQGWWNRKIKILNSLQDGPQNQLEVGLQLLFIGVLAPVTDL